MFDLQKLGFTLEMKSNFCEIKQVVKLICLMITSAGPKKIFSIQRDFVFSFLRFKRRTRAQRAVSQPVFRIVCSKLIY